jgi:ribosomal protein S18 acetylase RimI-like enzyme
MITISKPKYEDAEAIYEIIKASWYATYIDEKIGITKEDVDAEYTPEIKVSQIKALHNRAENPKDEDVSLIAKDDEKVVGYIRFKIHLEFIEWLSLYAHPEYFGKGIGTMLWQEASKLLPTNKPITVEVATYTKAVDFYKKLGFVDTGERSAEHVMQVSKTPMPIMKLILNR